MTRLRMTALLLMLFLPTLAWSAGPILVDTDGTGLPIFWEGRVVHYNAESGADSGLGRFTNAEAVQLIRDLLAQWQEVTINGRATVSFEVSEGSGLGNVDENNINNFFSYCPPDQNCPGEDAPFVIGSARTGQSPIIFDSDGSITDLIEGNGAKDSILGFAGPRVVESVDGQMVITEGQAVLNGYFIDCAEGASATDPCQDTEVSLAEYEGVIFHEMGHFIGLDHTQVNLASALKSLNGDDSEVDAIPTMFPLFVDGVAQGTPHYDDKVAVSTLYPAVVYSSQFCTLSGTVYEADGSTELQGVNVVAARSDNTLEEATSFVSGSYYTGTVGACGHLVGDFSIGGLIPGASYQLSIERLSQAFTGGSSIEPCDPPLTGFTAKTLDGLFSCSSAGTTITAGTVATTEIVTSKTSTTSTTTGSAGGGSSSSSARGCSLIP